MTEGMLNTLNLTKKKKDSDQLVHGHILAKCSGLVGCSGSLQTL